MSIDALFRDANSRQMAGDFAGAERRYRALIKLQPLWAYHNLGALYLKLGRDEEAEVALRAALRADPTSAATRHSLGMLLLRLGRYAEGWPEFEARRQNMAVKLTRPNLPYPEWRGEDLAGKHLVVVREQGFGDQIQFARFLPRLRDMAAKVTFVCSPNLVRLFSGLGVELIPASEAAPPASADVWTPDCSLGLKLGVTLETLPAEPYLAPAPLSTGGGVGVMAAGSPTHANDRNRSLPGGAAARLLALGRDLGPQATGGKDFQDTAEVIAGLDLVISVDTAVAHLAAAMGKPTWILLPAIETDWRWLTGRSDSPWYATARLYRQPAAGDWAAVIKTVTRDLEAAGLSA
jgi:hypothetical protein